MTILVVAADPDDEALGAGGPIARRAAEGADVHIRILGEGVTARYEDPEDAPAEELDELHTASNEAGEVLGATSHRILGLPDNRFDAVRLLDIIKQVESVIAEVEPTIVLTQHGGDLNVDHQRTFRAVLTATRPQPGHPVEEVGAFEVPSSTEWAFDALDPDFEPDTFVDVTDTIETRIEALKVYEQETREAPHPRSPESQRTIARRWGSVVGLEAVEAFQTVRRIV